MPLTTRLSGARSDFVVPGAGLGLAGAESAAAAGAAAISAIATASARTRSRATRTGLHLDRLAEMSARVGLDADRAQVRTRGFRKRNRVIAPAAGKNVPAFEG